MLVEFAVSNFLSFKEETILSLVAVPSDDRLPDAVTREVESGYDIDLLHSLAVFGANASGKSNLIDALWFMKSFIAGSLDRKVTQSIPVSPFKLSPHCEKQPSTFRAVFYLEGERYVYGFAVDRDRVQREWLYSYPESRRRILFERDISENPEYYFGGHWRGPAKSLTSQARKDALFLSLAARFNNPIALSLVTWFSDQILRVPVGGETNFTMDLIKDNPTAKAFALSLLRAADLGIVDLEIEKRLQDEALVRVFAKLKEALPDEESFPELAEEYYEPSMMHRATAGEQETKIQAKFRWHEESAGTQKLFSLIGPWIHVLSKGSILLADELDTRLHPLLVRKLVELFQDKHKNPEGAQLLLTTHNTNLLDQSLFRRDQVWFTSKTREGATDLYSLWDYKARPRKGTENLEKRYLTGRYGAIPFLGSFSIERLEETSAEVAQSQ